MAATMLSCKPSTSLSLHRRSTVSAAQVRCPSYRCAPAASLSKQLVLRGSPAGLPSLQAIVSKVCWDGHSEMASDLGPNYLNRCCSDLLHLRPPAWSRFKPPRLRLRKLSQTHPRCLPGQHCTLSPGTPLVDPVLLQALLCECLLSCALMCRYGANIIFNIANKKSLTAFPCPWFISTLQLGKLSILPFTAAWVCKLKLAKAAPVAS